MPIRSRRLLLICCLASVTDGALAAGSEAAGPASESRPPRACVERRVPVAVAAVNDDASVRLTDGRTLRLAGIDSFAPLAPDRTRRDEADATLARWMRERTKTDAMETAWVGSRPDRYGRLPALVAAGSEALQVAAARAGMTIALPGARPDACIAAIMPKILAAEDDARQARRGLWNAYAVTPAGEPSVLAARAGHFAIVEGRIATVGNRAARTYLNFGGRWNEDVTVTIAARDRDRFGGEESLASLAGRLVRFRGIVENRGGPSIELRDPASLEIVDAAQDLKETTSAGPAPENDRP